MFETKVSSHLKPDLQSIDDNWVVCELGNKNVGRLEVTRAVRDVEMHDLASASSFCIWSMTPKHYFLNICSPVVVKKIRKG